LNNCSDAIQTRLSGVDERLKHITEKLDDSLSSARPLEPIVSTLAGISEKLDPLGAMAEKLEKLNGLDKLNNSSDAIQTQLSEAEGRIIDQLERCPLSVRSARRPGSASPASAVGNQRHTNAEVLVEAKKIYDRDNRTIGVRPASASRANQQRQRNSGMPATGGIAKNGGSAESKSEREMLRQRPASASGARRNEGQTALELSGWRALRNDHEGAQGLQQPTVRRAHDAPPVAG